MLSDQDVVPEQDCEYQERAAILQYQAGFSRWEAERRAREMVARQRKKQMELPLR